MQCNMIVSDEKDSKWRLLFIGQKTEQATEAAEPSLWFRPLWTLVPPDLTQSPAQILHNLTQYTQDLTMSTLRSLSVNLNMILHKSYFEDMCDAMMM